MLTEPKYQYQYHRKDRQQKGKVRHFFAHCSQSARLSANANTEKVQQKISLESRDVNCDEKDRRMNKHLQLKKERTLMAQK